MRVALILLLLIPWLAPAQPPEHVYTAQLNNGLKLLVQEDHTIPTVALYFFFRVGSRDEHPGITGISHFFEHMMFNGSKSFPMGQFDRLMEQNGGNNNAYTTKDVTVYTDWIPPSALELTIQMEADRIANLTLDPKVVESERGVVYSERRTSVDNDNTGALSEQLIAAAFTAHPYHWPVIGWPSDIEAWTREDLQTYYVQGYAPNNCVMVVVGDVAAQKVEQLARKYLEPIPSHQTFSEPRTKEPEQAGERVVTIRKEAELPLLMMAFHMPESRNADMPAIQLAETLLSTGNSSRLHTRLVDHDQLALNVQVFDEPSLNPYILGVLVQPRAGAAMDALRSALTEELERLGSTPVPEPELRKAKNQWLAAHYRELKTVAGRANQIGSYEVFHGNYARLYSEPADVEKVTAADLQRVSKDLFRSTNRTVAILEPEHAGTKVTRR